VAIYHALLSGIAEMPKKKKLTGSITYRPPGAPEAQQKTIRFDDDETDPKKVFDFMRDFADSAAAQTDYASFLIRTRIADVPDDIGKETAVTRNGGDAGLLLALLLPELGLL